MDDKNTSEELFISYFRRWIDTYKRNAVRAVTLQKYENDLRSLTMLAQDMRLCDITRISFQELMNRYAETHEKVTAMDFYHHLKAVIQDAVDEGLVNGDPTRRIVVKGKPPKEGKKDKFLSRYELDALLRTLNLGDAVNFDWLILLLAKTGMRFSEALAITPKDFDFKKQRLTINKTWDYKAKGGFVGTKNASSVRTINIDWQTAMQFYQLCEGREPDKPIFVNGKPIYNSTINGILEKHCREANIPVIGVHGLRHTHASLLLSAGVSVASVSKRLGHSNMATTQRVYLHVIKELDDKDTALIMTSLTGLGG